jgi:hypothetical protein
LISAMNPTPQEAFSSAGSNRPKPDALIVVALPRRGLEPDHRGLDAIHPTQARVFLRHRARPLGFQQATFVPRVPAALAAFSPPADAPSPRQLAHRP